MAGGAVPLGRIIEEPIAAQLGRRQSRLAREPGVEFAGEGVESRVLELIARNGECCIVQGELRLAEDRWPEDPHEISRVGCRRQLSQHSRRRPCIHFGRVVQRPVDLLIEPVGASVPEETALRYQIGGRSLGCLRGLERPRVARRELCLVCERNRLITVRADAEGRLEVEVFQRRYRAEAGCLELRAPQHHGRAARRPVSMRGAVAARARHAFGGRQAHVVEQPGAELRHIGEWRWRP